MKVNPDTITTAVGVTAAAAQAASSIFASGVSPASWTTWIIPVFMAVMGFFTNKK